MKPTLYILSGLPGSGKSTLGKLLASNMGAPYIRIDTIEQSLRESFKTEISDEGYLLGYKLAEDILSCGSSVVADSCNPVSQTRDAWENVARKTGSSFDNIEIICTDIEQHRIQVSVRKPEVEGLRLPNWEDVKNREYEKWEAKRIVIDTAHRTQAGCLAEILASIK